VVATLGVTSCSEQPTVAVPPLAFGAPVELGPAPKLPQGQTAYQRELPVVLDQNIAYLGSPDGVQVADAASGQVVTTVRPQHPAYVAGPVGGPPLLTSIGDGQVVLWPIFVHTTEPVAGTSPDAGGTAPDGQGDGSAAPSASQSPDGDALPGLGNGPASAGASADPSAGASASPDPSASAGPSATAAPDSSDSAQPPAAAAPSGPPTSANAIELVSIRTDTHAATDFLVALPDWATTPSSTLSTSVLGAAGGAVVIALSNGLSHATIAADAASGRTLWIRDGFAAGAVVDQTVIGTETDPGSVGGAGGDTQHVSGLGVTDGKVHWSQLHGYGLRVSPAGPVFVAVAGQLAGATERPTFQLLKADTGAPGTRLSIRPDPSSRCLYDGATTTVCFVPDPQPQQRTAVGVDAQTGRQLWVTPDYTTSNEQAPLVTAAWHGRLYATSDGVGTKVYQADNRVILRDSAGPPPMVVSDHTGVGLDQGGDHVVARPAAP
jgi:hypothetical protein